MSSAASLLQGQGSHRTTAPGPTAAGSIEAPGRPAPPDAGRARRQLRAHHLGAAGLLLRRHRPDHHSVGLFPFRHRTGLGLCRVVGSPLQRPVRRPLSDNLPGCRPRRAPALFSAGGARNRICLPERRIPHIRVRRAANDLAAGDHLLDAHHDRPGADLPLQQHPDRPADYHPDRTRRGHAFLCPHDRTVRLRGTVWQHHAQDALRPQLRTEGGVQADRGACRTRRIDGGVQPALHHANAGGGDRPRDPRRIALLHRADRPRLVQAHQRRLRPSDRRRGAADILDHHVRQHPQRRPVRPLWRRGIPAGAARHGRRPGHAGARPVARHYCRSRLERVLAGHEGDDVGRRCNAESERDVRHYFSRAPTARFMQPRRRDATALPAPDPTYFSSGGGESAAGFCSRTES